MAVRVEIQSEIATSHDPARALVYEDNHLIVEVIAEVKLQQGADGRWYECVTLKKQELISPKTA